MGGSAGKVDDVTACRAVQDGGYALPWQRYDNNKMAAMLLWKRYGNNKMAAMRYYGNVIPTCR